LPFSRFSPLSDDPFEGLPGAGFVGGGDGFDDGVKDGFGLLLGAGGGGALCLRDGTGGGLNRGAGCDFGSDRAAAGGRNRCSTRAGGGENFGADWGRE
jgi:hypothetical protein